MTMNGLILGDNKNMIIRVKTLSEHIDGFISSHTVVIFSYN